MAYQEHLIENLRQIPDLVEAFAAPLGWSALGAPDGGVDLTRPDGGLTFRLSGVLDGGADYLICEGQTGNAVGMNCVVRPPRLDPDDAGQQTVAPTKVFILGHIEPEPYIALVIEFGLNLVRHLYIGNMEIAGGYSGGEVISCTNGWWNPSATEDASFLAREGIGEGPMYLFSANHHWENGANSGGVNVVHADNSQLWRKFQDGSGSQPSNPDSFPLDIALGGFHDGLNDGYVARGLTIASNRSVLVPIDLLVPVEVTGRRLLVPIGRPSGVRMVNMIGLDPYNTAFLGSDTWQIFPALSLKAFPDAPRSTSGWRQEETSYLLGYAYKV